MDGIQGIFLHYDVGIWWVAGVVRFIYPCKNLMIHIINTQSELSNIVACNTSFIIHCVRENFRQDWLGITGDTWCMEYILCILGSLRVSKVSLISFFFFFLKQNLVFPTPQNL
jgi:hypothetical protein